MIDLGSILLLVLSNNIYGQFTARFLKPESFEGRTAHSGYEKIFAGNKIAPSSVLVGRFVERSKILF
jgi:hypothetical protein